MAVKKKKKSHKKRKVICTETLDRVVKVITTPAVLAAATALIRVLRTGGKRR